MIAPVPVQPLTIGIFGGIGTTEIIIVLVVALIVLGPKQLPKVARTLGKALRDLRSAADGLRSEIAEDVADVRREMRDAADDVRRVATADPPPELDRQRAASPALFQPPLDDSLSGGEAAGGADGAPDPSGAAADGDSAPSGAAADGAPDPSGAAADGAPDPSGAAADGDSAPSGAAGGGARPS